MLLHSVAGPALFLGDCRPRSRHEYPGDMAGFIGLIECYTPGKPGTAQWKVTVTGPRAVTAFLFPPSQCANQAR